LCAVFLVVAFLFAGAGSAEAAKDADLKGSTLELFKAVALNDMPGVKKSIEDGADLYAQNEEGMTAADLAVGRGHFIVAHYLLSRRLARQTAPVALVPGRAKEAQKAANSVRSGNSSNRRPSLRPRRP
jgi:ankyrin repeat protein